MKHTFLKTLLSTAVLAAMTNGAFAAPIGTAAGTAVDNTASITYSVGGAAQTPIESSEGGNATPGTGNGTATTFVVDKKVDLLVTGSATNVSVAPNQTGAADNTELTYTLTNEGNSEETFALTASDTLPIVVGTNDFNTTNCVVAAPTSVTLASGDQATITVECDIPNSSAIVKSGAKSLVELLAEITGVTANNGDTDTIGCISGTLGTASCVTDVVFADGQGTAADAATYNGKHAATSTYIISSADLKVTKISNIVSDPTGQGNPKRIPGAIIKYTITVDNTGAVDATALTVADFIPDNMTFADASTTPAAPAGCVSSIGTCSLNATLTINGSPAGGKPGIESSSIIVPAAGSVTVTFYASVD